MCRHREVTTLGPLTFPQKAGSFDERRVSARVCPFWRTDDSTRGQETATKGSVMKSREDNSDLPPQPPHASPGVQPRDRFSSRHHPSDLSWQSLRDPQLTNVEQRVHDDGHEIDANEHTLSRAEIAPWIRTV